MSHGLGRDMLNKSNGGANLQKFWTFFNVINKDASMKVYPHLIKQIKKIEI
jgi:hypothetical protein